MTDLTSTAATLLAAIQQLIDAARQRGAVTSTWSSRRVDKRSASTITRNGGNRS